uniref:Uncharacterized protein n=1 Tax=Heliothis virescens TaxID=7102 RepID=A0A2A4JA96_HELVI
MKTHVEYDICDIPFDGYYAPPFQPKPKRFWCPLSRGFGPHDQRPPFDRFGHEHHHHWHGKPGAEFGPRFDQPHTDRDGRPSEHHWHGPPGFRPGPPGSHDFQRHGGEHPWFGRGPSDTPERSWGGPWGMFWGRPDQQRPGFGQGPPPQQS